MSSQHQLHLQGHSQLQSAQTLACPLPAAAAHPPIHSVDAKCASYTVASILPWQPGGIDINFADHPSAMLDAWSASEHLYPSLSSAGKTACPFHQCCSLSMCVPRQLMTCSALLCGSIVISALFCICAWHSSTCRKQGFQALSRISIVISKVAQAIPVTSMHSTTLHAIQAHTLRFNFVAQKVSTSASRAKTC